MTEAVRCTVKQMKVNILNVRCKTASCGNPLTLLGLREQLFLTPEFELLRRCSVCHQEHRYKSDDAFEPTGEIHVNQPASQ